MNFGLAIFPTDYSISPPELGRMVEARGFESLFFPEHTHIPTSRATPYPIGGELPREYSHTLDPFVALASVASVTETLRLGTGLCLLIERDPIITAKEVASLDLLSAGRVLLGVGAGWNLEEMENHGTDPQRRFGVLRERVQAMKAIWTSDEAEFHGEHVDFDPIWSWPKPHQRPHPPILVGGNGRGVLERVLRYGDEWIPNAIGDEDKLRARIEKFRSRARDQAGRELGVTLYAAPRSPGALERYAEAGVTRCVFLAPAESAQELEPRLDRYASLISELDGAGG